MKEWNGPVYIHNGFLIGHAQSGIGYYVNQYKVIRKLSFRERCLAFFGVMPQIQGKGGENGD